MFTNPFPQAFGLDIGDLSLKLVQLNNISNRWSGPRYQARAVRSLHLPYGLIVNGELQRPEQVRHYIKKLLQGNGKTQKSVKSPWVVAGLPETQSFIKLIIIDKPEDEIIEDDIVFEAKKHIPFTEKDKYYMDWYALPPTETIKNKTRVLIGAIPKLIADSYTYLLESLGLGVVGLEIEALSIARSMVTASKVYTNEARALLDTGATRSSLIIYDNDSIQFSTSLAYSGELLTTAIAQPENISYEEAERIKRESGLAYTKNKKAYAALMKVTDQLVTDIQKSIQFYYTHFSAGNKITHITMCGGVANMKKLSDVLTLKLKIECAPGQVWKNLGIAWKKVYPGASESESLTYATAIGLALRAADNIFAVRDTL